MEEENSNDSSMSGSADAIGQGEQVFLLRQEVAEKNEQIKAMQSSMNSNKIMERKLQKMQ